MRRGPRRPTRVDDPLAQQQLRRAVPGTHQITTHVLPDPDQIPSGFLRHGRDRDRRHLNEAQQPGQVQGVLGVGLDPIAGRALQLRRRRHHTPHPLAGQEPGQPEAGRPRLVDHRERAGQLPQPAQDRVGLRVPAAPGTSHPCHRRYRRPPPTGRAHPARHSYALVPPGPPAIVGSTGPGSPGPATHDNLRARSRPKRPGTPPYRLGRPRSPRPLTEARQSRVEAGRGSQRNGDNYRRQRHLTVGRSRDGGPVAASARHVPVL